MTCAPHSPDDPDIKGLYAEAFRLRDTVLRRLAAVGCEIDEASLPKARGIVSANIGEVVATPEYAMTLDRPGGENRILTLLVQSCAIEIAAKIRPGAEDSRKSPVGCVRQRTPLRLVVEN
jgi:hypothetical protein